MSRAQRFALWAPARPPRERTRPRSRLAATAAALALLLAPSLAPMLASGVARAQEPTSPHAVLVRTLLSAEDFRARGQAALSLGATNDRAVTPHLVQALRDPHASVRGAAATALARLGDPAALGALRAAREDRVPAVRDEVERAIRRIETAPPSTAAVPLPPAPGAAGVPSGGGPPPVVSRLDLSGATAPVTVPAVTSWRSVRHVVLLAPPENRAGLVSPGVVPAVEREVVRALGQLRGVATLREAEIPPEAASEMARRRLPRVRLEASVLTLEPRVDGAQLAVRCEVSILLVDTGHNLRGTLTGAATTAAELRGDRARLERALADRAAAAATQSAMGGAGEAIPRSTR